MMTYTQALETHAYYSDSRVQRAGGSRQPIVIDEEGLLGDPGLEYELATRMEVCPTCRGYGTHVNPAVDAGGFEPDDPADIEDYLSGVYDVVCYECGGANVVPVVDEARNSDALLALWYEQEQCAVEGEAVSLAEMRMGA